MLGILYTHTHTHIIIHMCVFSCSAVSNLLDPMDCNMPGSFVRGMFQARILGWVAIFLSSGSSRPTDRTRVSCIAGKLEQGLFPLVLGVWASHQSRFSFYRTRALEHKLSSFEAWA